MSEVRWERYPRVAQATHARAWLALQANLGRAANTVEAYGRALEDFLGFSARRDVDPAVAGREHVALYVRDLLTRPNPRGANVRVLDSGVGLANATLQQRLTAMRLYYDYLVEEGGTDEQPGRPGPLHAGPGRGQCR